MRQGVDMKRKAHESNIPPNPAPRIEFMILPLRGWKDWDLGLRFLGLRLENHTCPHYIRNRMKFLLD